jgi:hypothetical protein
MATSRRHHLIGSALKRSPWLVLELVQQALARAAPPPAFIDRAIPLPDFHHVNLVDPEATSSTVAERFTDGVLAYCVSMEKAWLAIGVEVQLDDDEQKFWRWPDYVVGIRTKLECPVELLVFCLDRKVAAWAAKPIRLGLGRSHIAPLVVTPSDITVWAHGRTVEDTLVLATLVYAGHPANQAARTAIIEAFKTMWNRNRGEAGMYADFVASVLHGEQMRLVEVEMQQITDFAWESEIGKRAWAEGLAEGKAEGLAEGLAVGEAVGEARGQAVGQAEAKADVVLRILGRNEIMVPADARERIASCTDLDTLDLWIDRALNATSIKEVLD